VKRLARLAADDRFDRNRSKITSTRLSPDPPIQETGAGFDRVDLVLIGGQVGGVR